MDFAKSHLSFFQKQVFLDELSYGEMFIINRWGKIKPMFYLGVVKQSQDLIKFKFKFHGESEIKEAILKAGHKVHRRAY